MVKTAKVMIWVKCLYPCTEFSVLEWRISLKPIFSDFSKIVILSKHLLSHLSLIYTIETSSNQYILPPPPPSSPLPTHQSSSWDTVPYFPFRVASFSSFSSSSVIVAHLQTIIESRTSSVKYAIIQTIDISLLEPTSLDRNLITLRANDKALWLPKITTVFFTGKLRSRKPPAIQLSSRNVMCIIEE